MCIFHSKVSTWKYQEGNFKVKIRVSSPENEPHPFKASMTWISLIPTITFCKWDQCGQHQWRNISLWPCENFLPLISCFPLYDLCLRVFKYNNLLCSCDACRRCEQIFIYHHQNKSHYSNHLADLIGGLCDMLSVWKALFSHFHLHVFAKSYFGWSYCPSISCQPHAPGLLKASSWQVLVPALEPLRRAPGFAPVLTAFPGKALNLPVELLSHSGVTLMSAAWNFVS